MEIDLKDERFHRRIIRWEPLIKEGICVRAVLAEAQKRRMFRIANSASMRLENERRKQQEREKAKESQDNAG